MEQRLSPLVRRSRRPPRKEKLPFDAEVRTTSNLEPRYPSYLSKPPCSSIRAASTGTKRQRKGGTEERRSSAPTTTSSVNYYDSSSLDFGEDVRTMAWEGVGSASYY